RFHRACDVAGFSADDDRGMTCNLNTANSAPVKFRCYFLFSFLNQKHKKNVKAINAGPNQKCASIHSSISG
ncbi:MAG: hypothetical protein DRH56_06970, partial [Deltaproteobacteria bacterium]